MAFASRATQPPRQAAIPTKRGRPRLPIPATRRVKRIGNRGAGIAPVMTAAALRSTSDAVRSPFIFSQNVVG